MKIEFIALMIGTIFIADVYSASSDQEHSKMPEFTKEQRSKMADLHENLAACLRSDKPVSDCRKQMIDSCRAAGETGCPMLERMGKRMRRGPY